MYVFEREREREREREILFELPYQVNVLTCTLIDNSAFNRRTIIGNALGGFCQLSSLYEYNSA